MKLKMAPNSLFAILLRSSWWISLAIAAAIVVVARIALPADYVVLGAFAAVPFLVIAATVGWKGLRTPSDARVARTLETVRAMSWPEFSEAIEQAFGREGHAVGRFAGSGADLTLTRDGRTTLVGCKRWKAARIGVEPLRDLQAARGAHGAHDCLYIAVGDLTDQARRFAAGHGIRLIGAAELARLLNPGRPGRPARTAARRA